MTDAHDSVLTNPSSTRSVLRKNRATVKRAQTKPLKQQKDAPVNGIGHSVRRSRSRLTAENSAAKLPAFHARLGKKRNAEHVVYSDPLSGDKRTMTTGSTAKVSPTTSSNLSTSSDTASSKFTYRFDFEDQGVVSLHFTREELDGFGEDEIEKDGAVEGCKNACAIIGYTDDTSPPLNTSELAGTHEKDSPMEQKDAHLGASVDGDLNVVDGKDGQHDTAHTNLDHLSDKSRASPEIIKSTQGFEWQHGPVISSAAFEDKTESSDPPSTFGADGYIGLIDAEDITQTKNGMRQCSTRGLDSRPWIRPLRSTSIKYTATATAFPSTDDVFQTAKGGQGALDYAVNTQDDVICASKSVTLPRDAPVKMDQTSSEDHTRPLRSNVAPMAFSEPPAWYKQRSITKHTISKPIENDLTSSSGFELGELIDVSAVDRLADTPFADTILPLRGSETSNSLFATTPTQSAACTKSCFSSVSSIDHGVPVGEAQSSARSSEANKTAFKTRKSLGPQPKRRIEIVPFTGTVRRLEIKRVEEIACDDFSEDESVYENIPGSGDEADDENSDSLSTLRESIDVRSTDNRSPKTQKPPLKRMPRSSSLRRVVSSKEGGQLTSKARRAEGPRWFNSFIAGTTGWAP